MESLFLILGWSGPIGIGIFLLCLGGMLYLLSKADATEKKHKGIGKGKGVGEEKGITASDKNILLNSE